MINAPNGRLPRTEFHEDCWDDVVTLGKEPMAILEVSIPRSQAQTLERLAYQNALEPEDVIAALIDGFIKKAGA
ncbi:MAG: hypothetical protein KDA80_19075 [Planctomycetaceae bacterium]|nr:hypothetical protein [Planctomycetaceae bacterium]